MAFAQAKKGIKGGNASVATGRYFGHRMTAGHFILILSWLILQGGKLLPTFSDEMGQSNKSERSSPILFVSLFTSNNCSNTIKPDLNWFVQHIFLQIVE